MIDDGSDLLVSANLHAQDQMSSAVQLLGCCTKLVGQKRFSQLSLPGSLGLLTNDVCFEPLRLLFSHLDRVYSLRC